MVIRLRVTIFHFIFKLYVDIEKSRKFNYHKGENDLKSGGEIRRFIELYEKNKNSKLYQALADTIMRANWKEVKEERKMCEALKELFADDLRESELKGRNAGKIEGAASKIVELVIKKYKKGYSVEETAEMLEESPTLIEQIYDVIGQCDSDCSVETIYKAIEDKTN